MSWIGMTDEEKIIFLRGYWDAVNGLSIWNNGTQAIGCLGKHPKEMLKRRAKDLKIDPDYLFKELNIVPLREKEY